MGRDEPTTDTDTDAAAAEGGVVRFPVGLDIPAPLRTATFRLEPLAPVHNERDHAAWMSSIDHIRATPGFASDEWGPDSWPVPMSAAENLADLEMHAGEFALGEAFAYSVLGPTGDDVIGCVYIDPDETGVVEAKVRSWVRADRAGLDTELASAISNWLVTNWPVATARFPGRHHLDIG